MHLKIKDKFKHEIELIYTCIDKITLLYGEKNFRVEKLNQLLSILNSTQEFDTLAAARNGKYKARKIEITGIKFDSLKEARRYIQLVVKQFDGTISELIIKPCFILQKKYYNESLKKIVQQITYTPDFSYKENGQLIAEDVKGYMTDASKLRMKIFCYQFQNYKLLIT